MGSTIDNRKSSAVAVIPVFAKVESLQNDASRFHDQR